MVLIIYVRFAINAMQSINKADKRIGKMRFRIKKKCGKYGYLMLYPYAHCKLGATLRFGDTTSRYRSSAFIPRPVDPIDCRHKRQVVYNIKEGL